MLHVHGYRCTKLTVLLAERRVVREGCTWGPGKEYQGMTI